jgi:tRNA pseudouridine55 synthase
VRTALDGFVGTFAQRPPAFSARKHGGRTAYRAARAGEALDLPERIVTVRAIELLEIAAGPATIDARVDIRCGPGTYIRAIARDLGDRLGCGGHLHALRRTEAAGLAADDGVTPAELEALAAEGRLEEAILPVGTLLPLPTVVLDREAAWRFRHGSEVSLADAPDGRVAVFDASRLAGIGRVVGGLLRPEKVLADGVEA